VALRVTSWKPRSVKNVTILYRVTGGGGVSSEIVIDVFDLSRAMDTEISPSRYGRRVRCHGPIYLYRFISPFSLKQTGWEGRGRFIGSVGQICHYDFFQFVYLRVYPSSPGTVQCLQEHSNTGHTFPRSAVAINSSYPWRLELSVLFFQLRTTPWRNIGRVEV